MWGLRGPSVGLSYHFLSVAERLREKFSRIYPRSSVLRPVVTSRLNHPYPAEGAGVRAPGQAVASPQRAERSGVERSSSFFVIISSFLGLFRSFLFFLFFSFLPLLSFSRGVEGGGIPYLLREYD